MACHAGLILRIDACTPAPLQRPFQPSMTAFTTTPTTGPCLSGNTPGFKDKVKLVFVSFGSREIEGRRSGGRGPFGGDPKENADALIEAGINSAFYVSPNTAHEFQSWRRSLREIAPLLFVD